MQERGIGTNVICQIGLVVRDIERTARIYADLFGMDMPNIITTDPEEIAHTKFRDVLTSARAKLAFFRMGHISLELGDLFIVTAYFTDAIKRGETLWKRK